MVRHIILALMLGRWQQRFTTLLGLEGPAQQVLLHMCVHVIIACLPHARKVKAGCILSRQQPCRKRSNYNSLPERDLPNGLHLSRTRANPAQSLVSICPTPLFVFSNLVFPPRPRSSLDTR